MTDRIVIDHHLDAAAGVYRLITGIPIIETKPLTDANGATLLDDDDQSITEQVTVGYDDVVDVVFDAGDKRWRSLDPDDIAAEQRAIVQTTIDERPTQTSQAAAAPTALPGVGDALNAASP